MAPVLLLLGQVVSPAACTRSGKRARGRAEQRIVAFAPDQVQRLRLWVGKQWIDRTRTAVGWAQTPGRLDDGTPFPVDSLLSRLYDLQGRRVASQRGEVEAIARGKSTARVRLWLGPRRTIGIALYRVGKRVLVTTGDSQGVYEVPPGLLSWILSALGRETDRPAAIPLRPTSLGSIAVRGVQGGVSLRKRGKAWSLVESGRQVPADPDRVEALIRAVRGLRVLATLGKGKAARAQHPLGSHPMRITVDDGRVVALALGGACPKRPGGRVAHRQPDGAVLCVTPLGRSVLSGSYRATRLFSLSADAVVAVWLERNGRRLALRFRPGKGGWQRVGKHPALVDPGAAEQWVATLTALRAVATEEPAPAAVRPLGALRLRGKVGRLEQIELGGAPGRDRLWARRTPADHWLPLRPESLWSLDASGMALEPRWLCRAPIEAVTGVYRTRLDGFSEWTYRDRGGWHVLVFRGAPAERRAEAIGAQVDRYRVFGGGRLVTMPAQRWKPPVAGLFPVDRERLAGLLGRVAQLRALHPVAAEATPAHGLGRNARDLTVMYRADCKGPRGGRRCLTRRCALQVGAAEPKSGGCFVRRRGKRVVLLLPPAVCALVRRPLARRRVTQIPLAQLARITLRVGSRTIRLVREEDGRWRRDGSQGPSEHAGLGPTLLFLAPLRAQDVQGYGSAVPKGFRQILRVRYKPQHLPSFDLSFYASAEPGGQVVAVRSGRPVRYLVPAAPVHRLLERMRSR